MNKEKYFLVPESKINAVGEAVKKLPLGVGLHIWNQLIEIVDKCEFKGPLPKAKKLTKKAKK